MNIGEINFPSRRKAKYQRVWGGTIQETCGHRVGTKRVRVRGLGDEIQDILENTLYRFILAV